MTDEHDINEKDWTIQFEINEGKFFINGKDCGEMENTITQAAINAGLTWWEFAAVMLYIGIGQIAGKDFKAGAQLGLYQYSSLMVHIYNQFTDSLFNGDIEAVGRPTCKEELN